MGGWSKINGGFAGRCFIRFTEHALGYGPAITVELSALLRIRELTLEYPRFGCGSAET
jgi:hypothetical protein